MSIMISNGHKLSFIRASFIIGERVAVGEILLSNFQLTGFNDETFGRHQTILAAHLAMQV